MCKLFSFLKTDKTPQRTPVNGETITFVESDASHKSTAYLGYTGKVEDSNYDGFVINEGSSVLVCKRGKVKYKKNGQLYLFVSKHEW